MALDRHPCERQTGESAKAFTAFDAYVKQGRDRSIRSLCQVLSRSRPLLSGWSSRNNWPARASAYDEHVMAMERAEMQRQTVADVKKWNSRLRDLNEKVHEQSLLLLQRAQQILNWPITRHETRIEKHEGTDLVKTITEIHPVRFDLLTGARCLELAN